MTPKKTTRNEKREIMYHMRWLVDHFVDTEHHDVKTVEKNCLSFMMLNRHCPSLEELKRLEKVPADDYPDGWEDDFEMTVLWFFTLARTIDAANRDFIEKGLKEAFKD